MLSRHCSRPAQVAGEAVRNSPGLRRARKAFPIVETVGCLADGPNNTWTLSNADRAGASPSAGFSQGRGREGRGGHAARLAAAPAHRHGRNASRSEHKGHKVLVKGLLIKDATGQRLNVTSLTTVGAHMRESSALAIPCASRPLPRRRCAQHSGAPTGAPRKQCLSDADRAGDRQAQGAEPSDDREGSAAAVQPRLLRRHVGDGVRRAGHAARARGHAHRHADVQARRRLLTTRAS